MRTTVDHPLSLALHDAAAGRFPAGETVEVGPAMPGRCDAVAFFSGQVVVAADVDEGWVREAYRDAVARPPIDPSGGRGAFLAALVERLGNPPVFADLLSVAPYRSAPVPGKLVEGGAVDQEWTLYHDEVRTYRYESPAVTASIALGRGPGARWDVQLLVERAEGKRGSITRQLLTAAKTLVPDRGPLFGMTPIDDLRVLRRGLAAEFRPICTELLMLTRPPAGAS